MKSKIYVVSETMDESQIVPGVLLKIIDEHKIDAEIVSITTNQFLNQQAVVCVPSAAIAPMQCYKPFSGRVLNLYAGLGGNRKKWQGVDVTAVEMEEDIANVYKANFPNDTVIIGDAHQYLLDHCHEFDFIWTSPPCQTHSRMMKATRHKKNRYTDMSLYQEILFLQHFYKGKWVVENVKPYYEPLIKPTAVIGRHYFWANFEIKNVVEPKQPKGFITKGTAAETQELKDWLGIHYDGNIYYKDNHCPGQVLRNCVHPDLGLAVFENGL